MKENNLERLKAFHLVIQMGWLMENYLENHLVLYLEHLMANDLAIPKECH